MWLEIVKVCGVIFIVYLLMLSLILLSIFIMRLLNKW